MLVNIFELGIFYTILNSKLELTLYLDFAYVAYLKNLQLSFSIVLNLATLSGRKKKKKKKNLTLY